MGTVFSSYRVRALFHGSPCTARASSANRELACFFCARSGVAVDEWDIMQIESFFPGRIRVSSKVLTSPDNVAALRERIEGIEGIKDLAVNPRTGSITILYDPKIITMDMLMEAKAELEALEKA